MEGYKATIICLANSTKTSGRCVAGRTLDKGVVGSWIRPIGQTDTHEISLYDQTFANGVALKVLDVVDINFVKPSPFLHQKENHLIAPRVKWEKIRVATKTELAAAVQSSNESLWYDACSSRYGLNDKVPIAQLSGIESSLRLVQVPHLKIQVGKEDGYRDRPSKKKVRAQFVLAGVQYRLAITDPIVVNDYWSKDIGTYEWGPATLCISLSEPIGDHAIKLVATVLKRE